MILSLFSLFFALKYNFWCSIEPAEGNRAPQRLMEQVWLCTDCHHYHGNGGENGWSARTAVIWQSAKTINNKCKKKSCQTHIKNAKVDQRETKNTMK